MSGTSKFLVVLALCLGGCLCLVLSYWQWQRGLAKSEAVSRMGADEPVLEAVQFTGEESQQFRRFRLSGRYQTEIQFVLTYRVHHDQPGYEILTPFRMNPGGGYVLVNRGWIDSRSFVRLDGIDTDFPGLIPSVTPSPQPNNPDENRAEDILGLKHDAGASLLSIEGMSVPITKGFRLGRNDMKSFAFGDRRLFPLLYLDEKDIETALGFDLQPMMLILGDDQVGSLTRVFAMQSMNPAKHWAYAVQWLIFALLQWIIALIYFRRQINNRS